MSVTPAELLRLLGPNPRPARTGMAYVAVRVVVYVLALVVTVLVYSTKERGLIIAPPIGILTVLATWYLLGDTTASGRRRVWLSLGVGLLLSELTWALGYWTIAPLMGGALLWLAFYVLSGVVEHTAADTLDRRIGTEYASVAVIGTVLVLVLSRPWSA